MDTIKVFMDPHKKRNHKEIFNEANSNQVCILGRKYNISSEIQYNKLLQDIQSRFWFPYRKNFSPIGGTGPTTDSGWGCMLRCGQMMLAEALVCRHLGRSWHWDPAVLDFTCQRILGQFLDKKDACYSLHQIAQCGVSEGKAIGQWFGPNTVAHVLKKLVSFDSWSNMVLHVGMDNVLIIDDVDTVCQTDVISGEPIKSSTWKPLVLVMPLRLGLSELNQSFIEPLKTCFEMQQTLGVIGGKVNHAHYFIGYCGNRLLYLDPHVTLDSVGAQVESTWTDESTFHCSLPEFMSWNKLDPSIGLAFYCHDKAEWRDLCRRFAELTKVNPPLFEVIQKRPTHFPPLELHYGAATANPNLPSPDYYCLDEGNSSQEIDEDFVLL